MNELKVVSVEEVKEAVHKNGFNFIACRPLSKHPDDWYLHVVLAHRDSDKEYVTWVYNASLGGLYEGRYTKDGRVARDDFHTRV